MRYENEKLVNDDGPSRGSTSSGPWANIRASSILQFVNKVSASMGAPADRVLREMLYDTVFAEGQSIRYNGVTYTGPMLLSMYFRNETSGNDRALVGETVAAVGKGWA